MNELFYSKYFFALFVCLFAKVDNGDNDVNVDNIDGNDDGCSIGTGGCGSLDSIFARNSVKFAIRKMLMKSELQNGHSNLSRV